MFGFSSRLPAAVQRSLLHDRNALQVQSLDHPDGWGVGYYPANACSPTVLRSINPAYVDDEFAEVASRVRARVVVAHVRRASCGPVSLENTHPFHHGRWLFAHNGTVSRFAECRVELESLIDPDLRQFLHGQTDSERCFLLVLTHLRRQGSLEGPLLTAALCSALKETVHRVHCVADATGSEPSSLTFLLSDGRSLVALRDGRSLHYSLSDPPGSSNRELLIASEVTSAERDWTEVSEGEVVGLDVEGCLFRSQG